jgi:hypothetical protein
MDSRSRLSTMAMMAMALGADQGPHANDDRPRRVDPNKSDHQKFHDEMRLRCRQSTGLAFSGRIYRRPMPKLYKGKKMVRAVKRAKVAAMKEAGHFKGDNRPVVFEPTF